MQCGFNVPHATFAVQIPHFPIPNPCDPWQIKYNALDKWLETYKRTTRPLNNIERQRTAIAVCKAPTTRHSS